MTANLITDVPGLTVGNAGDDAVLSGVTVVLPDAPAICAVDARGGAPGTRETDALSPDCLVDRTDAVVLSGGSIFGLDAAAAVTHWLAAQGRGFQTLPGVPPAPIVPGCILFDLPNGGDKSWVGDSVAAPYQRLGLAACEAAGKSFALGNVGAGLGAVAGTLNGGLGSASAPVPGGGTVGAVIAVNSYGSAVVPETGAFYAAPFEQGAEFGGRGAAGLVAPIDPWAGTKGQGQAVAGANTTIGVVATDIALTKAQAHRVCIMAQDGLARALRPIHTPFDGDTLFMLSTGLIPLAEPAPQSLHVLGSVAADVVARAVARGVYEATTIGGLISWRERYGG